MACPHSVCRLQEQPGQMVPLWAPPSPPTRLSGKLLWLGHTRASSWRKLKASVGIGSPEDGVKLLRGCGRRVEDHQAGFRKGFSHLAHPGCLYALLPSPFPSQSICGDCVQGQKARPAAFLQKGEKGDQGIPGVPGLDNCARVGGWAQGQLWCRDSTWWPHLTKPLCPP